MPLMALAYYGGKNKNGARIRSLLPETAATYVEPFCGSLAVLLNRRPAIREIANDMDGLVVNFFRCLRDRPDELVRALQLTPVAREEFRLACRSCSERLDAGDHLEAARLWYVRTTQAYARLYKGPDTFWEPSVGHTPVRREPQIIARKVDHGLALIAKRLRHVTLESMDGVDLLARHSDPSVLIYADPPYPDVTRTDPKAEYPFEFQRPEQHRRLLAAALASASRVAISSYPNSLYDETLRGRGWMRANFPARKTAGQTHTKSADRSTEAVYLNYIPPARRDRSVTIAPV